MSRKTVLLNGVNRFRDLVFDAEKHIWNNPETGFKEWKTSKYMEDKFIELGHEITRFGDIPGFYADVDTGVPGPTVLVIGEMDALLCNTHPNADPETHAVHACGHNAQCASLLGLAGTLKVSDALTGLAGKIRLMAVPAEEMIELNFREGLKQSGNIRYLNGKAELMHRGFMDGVDLAILIHGWTDAPNQFLIRKGSNGCVVKNVSFKGRAAHAGSLPHLGINALYAATQGLNAINILRETFKEGDRVRVHSIIANGGDVANTIPDTVIMESIVRGANTGTIVDVNGRVNLALSGSAASIGARVSIADRTFYYPLTNDANLMSIAEAAAGQLVPKENIRVHRDERTASSTDMGDLSAVMPAIQLYCSGAAGTSHGSDYQIADVDSACINAVRCYAMMINSLLENNAELAHKVMAEKNTAFATQREYLNFVDRILTDRDGVVYKGNGLVMLQS